jgi:hypothetical protein
VIIRELHASGGEKKEPAKPRLATHKEHQVFEKNKKEKPHLNGLFFVS